MSDKPSKEGDTVTSYNSTETEKPLTRAELRILAYKDPSWRREQKLPGVITVLSAGEYVTRLANEGTAYGGVTSRHDPLRVHTRIPNSPEFLAAVDKAPDPEKWADTPPLNTYGAVEAASGELEPTAEEIFEDDLLYASSTEENEEGLGWKEEEFDKLFDPINPPEEDDVE